MSKDRIMTLHPQGKKGVNIDLKKYNQIKQYILNCTKKHGKISYQQLDKLAVMDISDHFDGKVGWYIVTVKLDLEARGIIERVPKTSPHEIQLVK